MQRARPLSNSGPMFTRGGAMLTRSPLLETYHCGGGLRQIGSIGANPIDMAVPLRAYFFPSGEVKTTATPRTQFISPCSTVRGQRFPKSSRPTLSALAAFAYEMALTKIAVQAMMMSFRTTRHPRHGEAMAKICFSKVPRDSHVTPCLLVGVSDWNVILSFVF